VVGAYGVRPWARRRFMTSCAMIASTPRSAPLRITRRDSIIPVDTARRVTCRLPQHSLRAVRGRQLLAQPAGTRDRQTRWVRQRMRDNRQRCPHRGGTGPVECGLTTAGRADTPRNREAPVEHAPTPTVEKVRGR
jgi:hypothetical protein